MRTIDELRRVHRRLHTKLTTLQSALDLGPDAWFVIRDTCFSISKLLRDHIKREGRLTVACSKALGHVSKSDLERFALEHHAVRQQFQVVNWILAGEPCFSLDGLRPVLVNAIATLRHEMEEQEAKLFPSLEVIFDLSQVFGKDGLAIPSSLEGSMTVQHVLKEYPNTKGVFKRFHVSVDFERYETLDEVAWSHGIGYQQLLESLEEAVAGVGDTHPPSGSFLAVKTAPRSSNGAVRRLNEARVIG